jgi:hypothetical protein
MVVSIIILRHFYVAIYFALQFLKIDFAPGAIPGLITGISSAYTGMWLMTRKSGKLDLVDVTNVLPFHYTLKGYVFTR